MTTTRRDEPAPSKRGATVPRARPASALEEGHPQGDVFAQMRAMGHEQILLSHDPSCGYLGIVAIHDTTLGPALGGTRFWHYASTDEAITDALRLARGMTYKSAVAGINLGGGKSVIIGDNKRADREALFRAHGRFIETLGGGHGGLCRGDRRPALRQHALARRRGERWGGQSERVL